MGKNQVAIGQKLDTQNVPVNSPLAQFRTMAREEDRKPLDLFFLLD